MERKSYPISLKSADEAGIIEAIVSVFNNVDAGKEIVRQGFFQKSIERKLPKGVWAHDWKQPIAKTLEAKELSPGDPLLPAHLMTLGGAYIKGQFNLDTQRGREAYSDIKFGIIDEFSIGYAVLQDGKDKETGARELIEGNWKEWSPVLVGMNDQTALLSIKAEDEIAQFISNHDHQVIIDEINRDLPDSETYLKGITEPESFESFFTQETGVEEFVQKMQRLHAVRLKEGRILSSANRAKVQAAYDALGALLTESEPKPKEKQIDMVALRTQSERRRHDLMSLLQ